MKRPKPNLRAGGRCLAIVSLPDPPSRLRFSSGFGAIRACV
jgi:hypothetical protein